MAHYADSKRECAEIHRGTWIQFGNIVLSDKKKRGLEKGLYHIICVSLKHAHNKHRYFKGLSFQKPQARRTKRINRQIVKLKESLANVWIQYQVTKLNSIL